jgi:hypothetical protein
MTLAAETSYVRQGRALFPALFPNGDFDSPIWDVRHLRTSRHKTSNSRLHFTRYGSETDGLPPRFANVVKAYLMLSRCAAGTMSYRVDIARMLWEAIASRFGDSHGFDWSLLTEEDLLKTEQVMLAHWSPSTTYKRSTQLQFMMRSLSFRGNMGSIEPARRTGRSPCAPGVGAAARNGSSADKRKCRRAELTGRELMCQVKVLRLSIASSVSQLISPSTARPVETLRTRPLDVAANAEANLSCA